MASAPAYRYGRGAVASDIRLAELPGVDPETAHDVVVQRGAVPTTDRWDREWRVGGEISQRLARVTDGYLLRIEDRADCLVSADGGRLTVASELAELELGRLLVHQVLPLAFARRGALLLHASSVVVDGNAIAFIGETGVGKSTAAATLAVSGARLLADDALWVGDAGEGHASRGTFAGIWLTAAACAALSIDHPPTTGDRKVHVLRGGGLGPPAPLRAVFSIVESTDAERDALIIEPLSAAELYFALYDNVFQLDPSDRTEARRAFARLTELVEVARGWQLKIPDSHARMPEVCARVRETMREAMAGR